MAFTPQQDVSGAAAFEKSITPPSPVSSLSEIGQNLFEINDVKKREGAAASKAAATAAAKTVFSTTMNQIDYDINTTGLSQDAIALKYGAILAEMDLNENQEALVSQKLGRNVFFTPPSSQDLALEAFSKQSLFLQQGQIAIEVNKAKAAGKPITEAEAVRLAVANNALNTQASAIAAAQGAIDFTAGFEGNLKTILNFKDAVLQGLSEEQGNKDLDLETLRRLQDGFLIMKAQKGFSEPTDAAGKELFKQMQTEFATIETLFTKLVDYDAKNVDARTKQMVAQIVLAGGENAELAQLALQHPQFLARLQNKSMTGLVDQLKSVKELPKVTYADLNFTPDVLALMGVDAETPLTVEQAFPSMTKTFENYTDPEYLAVLAIEQIAAVAAGGSALGTEEGRATFSTSVSTRSFILANMKIPSTKYFNDLFSDTTFKDLNTLEKQGDEGAQTANILRNQMKTALDRQETTYSRQKLGEINTINGLGFDENTGKFMITSTEDDFEDIEAVSQMYFGGDINELLKVGSTANIVLDRNERRPTKGRFYRWFIKRYVGGRDTSTDLEVSKKALIVLSSPTFRKLRKAYEGVSNYPAMRKKFKDVGRKLGLTPAATTEPVIETPNEPVIETPNEREPEITVTSLGEELGTEATPYTIETEEDFNNLPLDSWFINPSNGLVYQKTSEVR